jgi:hypothetical protein
MISRLVVPAALMVSTNSSASAPIRKMSPSDIVQASPENMGIEKPCASTAVMSCWPAAPPPNTTSVVGKHGDQDHGKYAQHQILLWRAKHPARRAG